MKPHITKLGTLDLDMVETTPVVFRGTLYRFEYVRQQYWANATGTSYFRFVDHETGQAGPPFARGCHLGNVLAEDDRVIVSGTNAWNGDRVDLFVSHDMERWESWNALNLPGYGIFNTSDIDFCEHRGRLVINYSWGDQQGIEHLTEARFDGTEAAFLKGWFPAG